MRIRPLYLCALVFTLLFACGDDAEIEELSGASAEHRERGQAEASPSEDLSSMAPGRCEGSTEWRYDPLGGQGIEAIPDDVHSVDDPTSGTGRRVAFDALHDAWLAEQESAVSEIYRSLEGLEGWGITAPIVIRFSDMLGPFPSWQESTQSDAMMLVRLEGEGVKAHPFEVQVVEGGKAAVIWPLGVLDPATEYALLITSKQKDAQGECLAAGTIFRSILEGTREEASLVRASERLTKFLQEVKDG